MKRMIEANQVVGPKSLRYKVVNSLLVVFVLYAISAWFVLDRTQSPVFDILEQSDASDQVTRVHRHIDAERKNVDLMVLDWAQWDDPMEYVTGQNENFLEDNLLDSNIYELGLNFGAVINSDGKQLWGESYMDDETVESLEFLFPGGFETGHALLTPVAPEEIVSGLIQTSQGLAIVASAAIHWNHGEGPPGGHFILGRLLELGKVDEISEIMLTPIDILSINSEQLPPEYSVALKAFSNGNSPFELVRQDGKIFALKQLYGLTGQPLAILRVELAATISNLGNQSLYNTMFVLVIAAFVFTLTLWFALSRLLLLPIERLTNVFRGIDNSTENVGSDQYLWSAVQHLTDARGSIERRDDEIGELIGAFDHLSFSLTEASSSVWRAAHLDGLTMLANRRLFMQRLEDSFDISVRESKSLALLFIDLDDFKAINDNLGHDAGDLVLSDVAARLSKVVGAPKIDVDAHKGDSQNLVARLGGDEFVIMLVREDVVLQADKLAANIIESIAAPYELEDDSYRIGACVGLAVFPNDAEDMHQLLSNADAAMYVAKRSGKNTWRRYTPGNTFEEIKKIA